MLNSCPNESSQEWKDILDEVNGNRDRALELWQERGYAEDESLNEEKEGDPNAEPIVNHNSFRNPILDGLHDVFLEAILDRVLEPEIDVDG